MHASRGGCRPGHESPEKPAEEGIRIGCMAPLAGKNRARVSPTEASPASRAACCTPGPGVPIGPFHDQVNRDSLKLARPTIERVVVELPGPTTERSQGMYLDAGYDDEAVYAILKEPGFSAPVRPRGEEAKAITCVAGFKARRSRRRAGAFMDESVSREARPGFEKKPETAFRFCISPAARKAVGPPGYSNRLFVSSLATERGKP
jgi:hypothetical protein